ncbi:very short patch repair endonuclease [Clostridium butyricum]|uniref:Very short patch repair endonuclease n=1 Tax=Clostridium butyricum TaxID=1492 RepID=A0A2S7FF10_CLOBU|nr:very short patch repair endonuclease [Clostridium butyricum]KHD13988.1 endonuclease [Clostridium butyricum]PPV17754.1 very short patch repair endonuclease [Clostridium butyricum]
MDNLTKAQRHKNMKNIKSRDTKIELRLRKALWYQGIRFRKNYDELPGKPDIAITKYRIAVFCDGEFFHGYNWNEQKEKLARSSNSSYWIKKISRNIERDCEIDKELAAMDWTVVHFWGKYILRHTDECVRYIEEIIFEKTVEMNYSDENNYIPPE